MLRGLRRGPGEGEVRDGPRGPPPDQGERRHRRARRGALLPGHRHGGDLRRGGPGPAASRATSTDAINAGVRKAYGDGYLRKSILADPLRRKNTGDNTPAVIHYGIVPGDKLKLTFGAKGGGSENMSRLAMLKPSDGEEGVKNFVVETVSVGGANACPPLVIGVGIGGNFEKSALLAKKAALRSPDPPEPGPLLRGHGGRAQGALQQARHRAHGPGRYRDGARRQHRGLPVPPRGAARGRQRQLPRRPPRRAWNCRLAFAERPAQLDRASCASR